MRDSGLFNYHLGRLVGAFVRKTESGYELRYAGQQVVGAVVSGTYTADLDLGPVPLAADCRTCGGTLEATYADDHGQVACGDCGETLTRYRMPAGLFADRDPATLPALLHAWVRLDVLRMDAGICPVCLGHAGGTLATDPPAVTFACARCGMHAGTGVQGVVLDHPAVVAFHHDRGVDLRTEPLWTLDWLFDPGSLTVFETDPPRVRVTVALGGDELACEVDEHLGVTVEP
jgi:predicted RNA-binding Zn-ribbon protein involved in translation (DUF1610 family)